MSDDKSAPSSSKKPVTPPSKDRRSLFVSRLLPWLVLLLALIATYQLWHETQRETDRILDTEFDLLAQDTTARLQSRMQTYEQVLRGTAGLFASGEHTSRQEFSAYYGALQLGKNYPGIQGVGFSLAISPSEREAHIDEIRSQGFPNYSIYPLGERDFYSSILYLEPFSGRNLRAFGYDMYSHPARREAMARARDTGESAITSKVTLVQEVGQDVQPGFLMYLPVYRPGTLNRTVEERRANLLGWVYAPFRMRDLMMGFNAGQYVDLDLTIYDGTDITDAALLYEGRRYPRGKKSRFVQTHAMQIRNRYWTVIVAAPPTFGQNARDDRAAIILKAGIAMSLLITLLTWLLVDERARAWRAADHAYRLALYDPLTQLPNRKLFNDRLHHAVTQAKREQERIAVMFIDLDKFKPVNDNFGHEIGDLLLVQVAERLVGCVRESDTVARLGGDEFVVLLAGGKPPGGEIVVAEKILAALHAPFHVDRHQLHISSSIGIALYPEHGTDENQLMRHADTAMYHAKHRGRNRFHIYDPRLQQG